MPLPAVGTQYCRPMAKPPQDPGSGPRIRARARGGTSGIRPEVVDALGEVERSLTEVAKWEQMLAGRPEGGPVIPALPEGYVGLSPDTLLPPAEPDADDEPEADAAEDPIAIPVVHEGGILDAVRAAEERGEDGADDDAAEDEDEDEEPRDAAAAADALVAPLLTEFKAGDAPEEPGDGSVLWAARQVEESAAQGTDELIAKRRRNARILSWAGALVLVAGAALWLVPDRSGDDDDQLPPVDVTATTQRDRNLLTDETELTLPSTSSTKTTTASTTATTRKTTATTVRRSTPTTTPTTAPPATSSPNSTLGLPGNPGTVNPSRTVPTAPPTTPPTTPTTPPTEPTTTTVQ
jgi:hypothetical protein